MHRMFRLFATLTILWGCLPAAAVESAERIVILEAAIGRSGSIAIDNLLGSIHIVPSDAAGAVRLEARIVAEAKEEADARALAESIRITQNNVNAGLRFHVAFPVERHTAFRPPKAGVRGLIRRWAAPMFHDPASVTYQDRLLQIGPDRKAAALAVHVTLAVPYDVAVTVRHRIGSVEGRALRGRLRISTVDGLVALDRCLGTIEVESDRADVHVNAFQGKALDLKTTHGNVELVDVRTGQLRLETESGAIRGDNVVADALFATSASGDLKFGNLEPTTAEMTTGTGEVDLATHLKTLRGAVIRSDSGDVTLRVGQLAHFALEAETQSGKVKTLGGVELDLIDQQGLTTRLQQGQGGAELQVSAVAGNVIVRPYDGSRLDLLIRRR